MNSTTLDNRVAPGGRAAGQLVLPHDRRDPLLLVAGITAERTSFCRLVLRPATAAPAALLLVLLACSGCDSGAFEAYDQGMACAAEGDLEEAVASFDEAIGLSPRFTGAYYQRGIAHYNRGLAWKDQGDLDKAFLENDLAILDFGEAIRLNPGYTEARRKLREARENPWRYKHEVEADRRILECTEQIRLRPKDPQAYISRGGAYREKADLDAVVADYDEAIGDFTRAILLDPEHAQAYCERGTVHGIKGDLHRAMTDYNEAVADYDKAVADFRRAIRLGRQQAQSQADQVDSSGDPAQQAAQTAESHDLPEGSRDLARAYYGRGEVHYLDDKLHRAVADFSRAILLDPDMVEAYTCRGLAQEALGNTAQAAADRARAEELDQLAD